MENQDDYAFDLCQKLTELMTSFKTSSDDVIKFMSNAHVPANIYLPLLPAEGGGWAPLIYFCCRDVKYIPLLSYLLSLQHPVDLSAQPRDCSKSMELLYYCRPEYIPVLCKLNMTVNPNLFPEMGRKLITSGSINKLLLLRKWNAVSNEQLINIVQDHNILFLVTEELHHQIGIICHGFVSHRLSENNFSLNYKKIMDNYLETYKFLYKNIPININDQYGIKLIQRVLDTYLIELIALTLSYKPDLDDISVKHYSNFDQTTRQIMNKIYNNDRFTEISQLLSALQMPKKIIVKKTRKINPE